MHTNQISQDVIGSSVSPVTLSTAFADTVGSTMLARDFCRVALDVSYAPRTAGAYAQLILEYSNDELSHAGPTNWRQFVAAIPATTQVDVYGATGDQMGTVAGTPINVPTSGTSVASRSVSVHISPDTELNAKWVRVRAKEVNGTIAGTLHVIMSLH